MKLQKMHILPLVYTAKCIMRHQPANDNSTFLVYFPPQWSSQ